MSNCSNQPQLYSFKCALRGIRVAFADEPHARFEAMAAIAVFFCCLILSISVVEWLAVIGVSALVIALEMVNSSIERLCDVVHPSYSSRIRDIKDLAAGAVLIAAVAASVVGALVFIPYIL